MKLNVIKSLEINILKFFNLKIAIKTKIDIKNTSLSSKEMLNKGKYITF